jgi:predicted aspartyl protease
MLHFAYNKSERPPAPYIAVDIAPTGRRRKPIPRRAKLDSGASITVIPESLIKRWRLPSSGAVIVQAYNGSKSMRFTYSVDIIIGGHRFRDIEVTVAPRRTLLLGRNLLNKLRITLDGIQEQVEIHNV